VRAKAHREMSYVSSQAVCNHINNFVINEKHFKVIAVYMPIQTEIDILPVIPRIRELEKFYVYLILFQIMNHLIS